MTARRSITHDPRTEQTDNAESTANSGTTDRRKFTQRMPEGLVEDIDEFATEHGMSRNAAINMLAKTGLNEF